MELIHLKKRDYVAQRSPTLNTVLMVEQTIIKANKLITVAELKRRVPKQIMHQTLIKILDYLTYSGKIVFHDNKVLWTYTPESKLKKIKDKESILTMLASEESLKKDWENEADERWNYV